MSESPVSESPTMAASLKVVGGKQEGQLLPLQKGKFLIGREEDCHLRPNSDLVSRHHCVFSVDDYSVRLRDLGSTNGTFVNGEQLRGATTLKAGDRVSVGKLEFEIVTGDGADAGAAAAPAAALEGAGDILEAADPAESGTVADVSAGGETMIDMPVVAPEQFNQPAEGDTTYNAQMMPPPQQPMFGYPQQYPGYPPQQMPPGYGMPPGGFPPQGYPQQYPGYPPQQMPPGYPPQGYPQQQMPPQGYPQQPPPEAAPEPEPEPEEPAGEKKASPQVSLPDPSQTGAKAPEPKAPPKEGGGGGDVKIPDVASGIIKQYFERRPKT